MKRADPAELQEDVVPVMMLSASELRLRRLFPIPLTDADPLSEPEPSKGALIRLDGGGYVVLMSGLLTRRATVSVLESANAKSLLHALLREIEVRSGELEWVRETERAVVASARKNTLEALLERETMLRRQLAKLRRATPERMAPRTIGRLERELAQIRSKLGKRSTRASKKREA